MKRNTLRFDGRAFQGLLTVSVCLLGLLVAACAASPSPLVLPTYTPLSTYTPLPTYTLYPTFTPMFTATPWPSAAASPLPVRAVQDPSPTRLLQSPSPIRTILCIPWTEARLHVGETICVRGQVVSTYKSGSAFFIDFDYSRVSFYSVSFKYTWDDLKRQCVEISGKIAEYRGRPQIVIDKTEQLNFCR